MANEITSGGSDDAVVRAAELSHALDGLQASTSGLTASANGFARAMWCGERACEEQIKEQAGASSRNMPFDQTPIGDTCVCCGKPAKKLIYFAKAY